MAWWDAQRESSLIRPHTIFTRAFPLHQSIYFTWLFCLLVVCFSGVHGIAIALDILWFFYSFCFWGQNKWWCAADRPKNIVCNSLCRALSIFSSYDLCEFVFGAQILLPQVFAWWWWCYLSEKWKTRASKVYKGGIDIMEHVKRSEHSVFGVRCFTSFL